MNDLFCKMRVGKYCCRWGMGNGFRRGVERVIGKQEMQTSIEALKIRYL